MLKRLLAVLLPIAVTIVLVTEVRRSSVQAQAKAGSGFAAIPGTIGGQDTFGAYDVVKGWPKDISTLPGNEKWTYGAGQSVYAESPNRVFMLSRGELPTTRRPQAKMPPDLGPSIQFPIARLPCVTRRRHRCPA